jgi:HNH endonuclease
MPRGFQNQLCVYCGTRQSTRTGDHVFPRSFFLEHRRANLPKVPACEQCNNQKSRLEHYLATIVLFGGRHADAGTSLEQMVPPRLDRNRRLHHELAQSRETLEIELTPGESATATVALPIDGERLHKFIEFAVKGLLGFH